MIFAEVKDADTVKVTLHGGVPRGAAVTAWARQHGAEMSEGCLAFGVGRQDVEKLNKLAAAFRSIVQPGAPRYAQKAYKYVCPRAAASLERLCRVLARHWE